MKQVILILGIFCLFIFVGCGQGDKSEQPTKVESKAAMENVKEKAGAAVETAKEKTQEAVEVAQEKTGETTEALKEKAGAAVEMAKEKTEKPFDTVKENTVGSVEMVKEQTKDTVEVGKEKNKGVLSETNMSPGVIKQIQKALQNAGHDPKYIDGVIGWRTTEAIKAYQKEKGLSVGALTYETIESLGVKLDG